MKLIVVLLLAASVAAQSPRDTFVTKFQNLVSNYLGSNTGKAVDMVAKDALALMSMDDITGHLMKEIIGLVPATKYFQALGMLTTFQGCIKKAGSTMDRAIAAVGGAFKSKLNPLLLKVQTKVKTMRSNKKAESAILNEVFNIANTDLTKALVQPVINAAMTQCTKAEYDCAVPPLNTVMPTSQYNIMRLLVVLLLIGSVAAQKAQFQTKFENLVTKYLGKNTG
ncbi:hypothetical protein PMAYCL1PPCAC_16775, partial [Pristionchus mayeri]